jgi:hypothetical protein
MDELGVIDATAEQELDLVEQPYEETPEAESAEKPEGQQTPEDKIDGRRFNPEWSKALKELRDLYPDRADMLTKLRDGYAREQAYRELAPKGMEDLRSWKTTLDALGGSEAAAEMMGRVAEIEQIDSRIEAGDFSVVNDLPESMQKGFYQMLPDAFNAMAEKDSQAFNAMVAPHFKAALANTGMGEFIKGMYAKAEGNPEVQALSRQLYEWFQQQTSGVAAMPTGAKTVDPQVQRLQAELETRRAADDTAFVSGITQATEKYVGESFTKNAEVYLKQLGLSDAQKSDLMDSFAAKLTDKLGADTAFNKQLAAYKSLKGRSADQVNTYIRSKIDEAAKPILDGLVTARYGGVKRVKAAPTTTTPTTQGGAVRVAQAPPQDQWDMAKMEQLGYEATVKKGLFYLQGGRTVQLAR